ncbi:MAG: bifunctional phosphoribosylaminoimidazolecarboxamide formyltransferase/IMP cyclohydrolase [Phycisphaerales bacterium]
MSASHGVDLPPPGPVRIKRALISVSDKAGIVEFAKGLSARGVSIISTGGTAKSLEAAGVRCTPIEEVTGLPEMMDGRVKTLHPAVHGGLLAVRDNPEHAEALRRHRIEPIDLVVINLYPFQQTVAKPGVTRAEAIENIDIGGPSMVRSAAKNHAYVAIVTKPEDYAAVIDEMDRSDNCLTPATRERLALAAFTMTAAYDKAISEYLSGQGGSGADHHGKATEVLPQTVTLTYDKVQQMRYGENPHQAAALYKSRCDTAPGMLSAVQHHGKELGYNNVADAAAALDLAVALSEQAGWQRIGAAVIKHANPCGAAIGATALEAIDRAVAGDPIAAFGGIIACSHPIDAAAAQRLTGKDTFLEVVIAPSFTSDALEMLKAKSVNVRLLSVGEMKGKQVSPMIMRTIPGGMLLQERDLLPPDTSKWQHVAGPTPSPQTLSAAAAIEIMVRSMSSNAIAIGAVDGGAVRLLGGGVGQVDRVTACRLAVEKARSFSEGLMTAGGGAGGPIAVSDAFFPFPDGAKILIDGGVKVVVHPGGSKRDNETIELCKERGVTCLLTGVRRFRH